MAGSIEKVKGYSDTFRLHYMFKGNKYSERVKLDNVKNHKTDKRLQLALSDFITHVEKGNLFNSDYTFAEFAQTWIDEIVRPNCSPNVTQKRIGHLNLRILPYLGPYKLNEISPLLLISFINDLKSSITLYSKRENKSISKATVQKIYSIVKAIMQKAYEFELIENNPCHKVKLNLKDMDNKNYNKETINYYDKKTYKKVLKLLQTETLEHRTVIELALKSGLRRSEMWGLTWNDIDFKNNTISVNKSRHKLNGSGMYTKATKTKSSIRTITIPKSLVEILKEYKIKYEENKYLFEQISIDGICSWFRKFQVKNNVTPIRFHDLRHTHATLLLLQKIDLKTIQERLGHSNIMMTMNTYTHVLKELDRKASKKIDELL